MQTPDQYFTLGGSRLRYRDEGHGSVLILIHGWTLDLEMWQPQALELSRACRVIRYDRRGYGLSSGQPSLAEDFDDLSELLDHLQVRSAVVLGMSQGARVALDLALRLPHRVSALILDGAPNPTDATEGGPDDEVPRAHYRELIRVQGMHAFRREWRDHPFVRLHTTDAPTHELLAQILARYPGHDLRETPPQPALPIEATTLNLLRKPVLILNGELDTEIRRRLGLMLSHALPFATRDVVPQAGHLANLDNPRAYNDFIRHFLARLARAAA
jgi:pimeloyl-ACP methyl ester carboxylesterase